jgi:hypothetical protein
MRAIGRDGAETCEPLDPSFWPGRTLTWLNNFENIRVEYRDADDLLMRFGAVCFFVRHKELDKLYPTVPPSFEPTPDEPLPRAGGRGKRTEHGWKRAVSIEVAQRIIAGGWVPNAPE